MSWKHYLVVWWKLQLMYWEAPCCSGWRTHSGSTFYINIVEYWPVFILRCPSFSWTTQLKHDQARPKFEPSTKALWLLSCPLTWRRTAASTSQVLSLLSSYIAGVLQPELVGDALVHETGASIVPFLMEEVLSSAVARAKTVQVVPAAKWVLLSLVAAIEKLEGKYDA